MKKLLKREDYDRIEDDLSNLIEDLGLSLFPMNCYEVASLLCIELKTYAEFSEADRDFIVSKAQDGFTIKKNGKYVIFYNADKSVERRRFTIWHEIAHIHLGHLEAEISYEQMEEEANHFAITALAPLALVHRLSLFDPWTLSSVCGVSFVLANYVLEHYKKAFQYESVKNTILRSRIALLLSYEPKEAA